MTSLSFVGLVPSEGISSVSLLQGIKLVIAGIIMAVGVENTVRTGSDLIDVITSTEIEEVDWEDIDWEKVGVSAVQKAIESGSSKYMWGSIVGAVKGGINGYEYYQKFYTPYTLYDYRIAQTPQSGEIGEWTGERGESDFIFNESIELSDGTLVSYITFKNGVPDYTPYEEAQVKIDEMTNQRDGSNGNAKKADRALAEYWTSIRFGERKWTEYDVQKYRINKDLKWYEMNNMEYMQLIPRELSDVLGYGGGIDEYNTIVQQDSMVD